MGGPRSAPRRHSLTMGCTGWPEAAIAKPRADAIMSAGISLKRVRDPAEEGDGTRVLVDRVWPRGVRKADAAVDRWLKAVAPSTELRKWFGHDPGRWEEFRRRYRQELAERCRRRCASSCPCVAAGR